MSIQRNRYFSPSFFEQETSAIFSRQMFVAHDRDFVYPDDYFSFALNNLNLTLRKNEDQPTLLNNVCRHRANLIDPPGFGSRKFRCSYHGWTYDTQGNASFIPMRSCFPDDMPQPRLRRHPLTSLSRFHFLGDLDEQRREEISSMLAYCPPPPRGHIYRNKMHHRCNWKLMVENVLEAYHLSHVHSDTFYQVGYSSNNRVENKFNRFDSAFTVYPDERIAKEVLSEFPDVRPSFQHIYIFPNLFITLSNELLYYVGNVVPINEQECMLHYRLYPTEKLLRAETRVRRAFLAGAIEFTHKVLKEDLDILESCQEGIRSASDDYLLGKNEIRLEHFHRAYNTVLGQTALDATQ